MTELQEKVKAIFEDSGIFLTNEDMNSLGTAISDSMMLVAEQLEIDEPYATVSIQNLKDGRSSVEEYLNNE